MNPAAESALAASQVSPAVARTRLFNALYREHFDFVFRNLRRLGVPQAALDDAVQEVYLVVLRQLDRYRDAGHPRAWLFAIAMRVASNQRRRVRRDPASARGDVDHESPLARPDEAAERAQAVQFVRAFLATLDDDKRNVFVLAELEQMTAPEISEALGANVNTVYARLRAARQLFARATARLNVQLGGNR